MDKQIFSTVGLKERIQLLTDNATAIEKRTYSRTLDSSEVAKMQTQFAQKAIELNIEETEMKSVRESFKLIAKPIKAEMALLMQGIRSSSEEITEEVYLLTDMDHEMMGYYSKEGELIFSRQLMQSEKQYSIVDNLKKVNG
jgi:hypothetical protein